MSYFNPKIYNKENLHDDDRKELEYWYAEFENIIENAVDGYGLGTGATDTLAKIKQEIVDDFVKELKNDMDDAFFNMTVGIIDGYEEDVPEQENPTHFGTLFVMDD